MISQTDVATFEHLHDGVIILNIKDIDGKFQRLLRIKESPLASFYSDEVPYEIVGNRPSIIVSLAYPPPVDRSHSETMILDDVSHEILSELQKDGRKTFEELGKKVGYTGMAVKKRIRNLMNHDIIRVSALLNIEKMGIYAAVTMLELESTEALDHLLDRFRNCPRVVNMFTTLGSYNTIILSIAEDLDTLQSVSLEKCSLRSNEGIRRSDFYPIGSVHYSSHLAVREYLAHRDKDIAPCRSNCRTCQRYQTRKCVGCPATRWYRGKL
jgi:DNA-binding Lrp family transcriptional regulator